MAAACPMSWYRGRGRNTASTASPSFIPLPTMSPSFMFLRSPKNNDKKVSSTSPPDVRNVPATPSTRKLRKPMSAYINQNSPHPYKEEEPDPKRSHRRHTLSSVFNPSIQNEITNHNKQPIYPPPYRQGRDQPSGYVWVDETPVVSQYLTNGHPNPQMVETIEQFTGRSWSPIPSVHRESDQDGQEYYEEQFEDEGSESWVNNHTQPSYSMNSQLHPRISTVATVASGAVVDSGYNHRDIGYQPTRIAPTDFWNTSFKTRVQDENAARRQRSLQRGPARETIEPPMFEREYVPEDHSEPEVYNYIVPAGLDVIFQDEDGNEIARVGKKPHVGHGSVKSAPIIVHDEFGKELYRTKSVAIPSKPRPDLFDIHKAATPTWDDYGFHSTGKATSHNSGGYHRPPWLSTSPGSMVSSTKTIMVDEHGNQLVLKSPSITREGPRRMEGPIFSPDISHHANIDHM